MKKQCLHIGAMLALAICCGCSGNNEDAYSRIELGRPVPPADTLGLKMTACQYGQGWGQKVQTQLPLSSTVKQVNILFDGKGNVIGKLVEDRSTVCLVTVVKVQANVSIELEVPDEWFHEPPDEMNWQALAAATKIVDATFRTFSDQQQKFSMEILPPPLKPLPRNTADLMETLLAEVSVLPDLDAARTAYMLAPRPKLSKNVATYLAMAVALLDRMPNQLGPARKTTLRNFAAELDRGPNNFLGMTSNQYKADFQSSSGKTMRITRLTERRFAIQAEDVQSYTPTQESLMSISEGE